ncbi:integrase family protein [Streptomyces albus]|uniref:Integrase family protein n=1 Tax=Streptomyces albus (strain ATCC 21838 / DSM 41398 / FERM P-419 / JCM 4703 / NBRC 107858) TaxID=1081613 RepID=A0A0B5ETC1_STRA4|nr:integrase family protein [Streptomyces albus]AOU76308.1 integrase family protein [Streptomyces albus]AYN32094.1 site-specific integrase [Streptomyces albus]
MAGHIQDRWYKTETDTNGKETRVKTDRHGTGLRYRARYIGPDGTEKSKSFPDRQKRLAEQWLSHIEADMTRGQYIDPKASRTTFRQFAESWLASQTTDPTTQVSVETRLRLHVLPRIGARPLDSFRPSHVQQLVRELEEDPMAGGYARTIYANLRAVLSSAVDDGLLNRNPCNAKSVRPPANSPARVVPWLPEQVFRVRAALEDRYRAMVDLGAGCGLRQGEIVGLAEDDAVDFEAGAVHVVRQVKLIRGKAVFAPPKCGKERDVPLPTTVRDALRAHMDTWKPVAVTLPWKKPDGPLVTKRLFFSNSANGIVWRSNFNTQEWKPALAAAGIIPAPLPGERYASAREHGMHALRHFYASVLLDAGESIKAVSEYLGHADPAMTLRVYAHLMPSSQARARHAVDLVFRPLSEAA